ncbi:MAG: oligosaccharide flippase family protein [Candidatus Paceibacterota bacterium]
MLYLAKGGLWVTSGQTITSILSLGLIVAFANLLPKETYGIYRYILALAGVLNIFTLTGMNSAVARAVASGNDGALKVSVLYQLKWNMVMLVAFWALSAYYFINTDTLLGTSFLILGVLVPPTLALNTYGAYLEGKKKFGFASISNIVSATVYVAGTFTAIIFSGEVLWLVVAYALSTFTSTLFFYFFIIKKFQLGDIAPLSNEMLKYGRELTFIRLIGPITAQIDKIILAHYWGPAQLATYLLALAVPDRVALFIKNWVGLGFPKFVEKTPEEINTVFSKRILQGMFVGGIIGVFYILLAPYFFKYLLPQYLDGVIYSQVLAISFLFAMPNRYLSLLFEAQKMSRIIFIRSIVQSAILLTLYTTLGIFGGILGLVIAYTLNSFISVLVGTTIWKMSTR